MESKQKTIKTRTNGWIILRPYLLTTILSFLMFSCDKWIAMGYYVQNKSDKEVTVFIPLYVTQGREVVKNDTVLVLKPNETSFITATRVMYPGSLRSFYRRHPGICGVRKLEKDTLIELGCSRKEWKFRKRDSSLILR